MKKQKIITVLLVILIFITSLPMLATAATNDIFFATDVHGKTANFTNVLSAVKKDTSVGVVALGGDYEVSASSLQSYVRSVFPDAKTFFTTGNHDTTGNSLQKTGEAFTNEHYSLFLIAYEDFKNANAVSSLTNYLKSYNTNQKTVGKPLFIMSHLPLHADRHDNTNAYKYADLLNKYGKTIDIIYMWGHNHTVDKTLWYKTIGDEITTEGGSKIKLNFSYITAGYIKEGYGLAVRVNADTITFQRYNTIGKYDTLKTINRIIPAKNCDNNGHEFTKKEFAPHIKAFTFSCKNCKETFYEHMSGDCDGNGFINAGDARLALRYSINLNNPDNTALAIADVNSDNIVSSIDARFILRKAVGLTDNGIKWAPVPVDKNGNKTE